MTGLKGRERVGVGDKEGGIEAMNDGFYDEWLVLASLT